MGAVETKAGEFTPEHFEMLVGGTSIRGKKVLPALEEHLVRGTPKGQSCKMHNANFSQFSTCLRTVMQENDRVENMVKFYPEQASKVSWLNLAQEVRA
jgi:hypothetical protein